MAEELDDMAQKKFRDKLPWTGIFTLLGPSGLWLVLLLVLPTLVIFELSLVPNISPGDLVNPSGLNNYFRIFDADNLKVVGRSLFYLF